jgi:hypothetical protein
MTPTEENGAVMDPNSIATAIMTDDDMTDAELAMIANAVKARRKHMTAAKTIGIRRGDHVKLGGNAPSRERGGVVIVRRVNEKTMTVLPSSPAFAGTKWARARSVRVPLSWIGEVV